MKIFFAKLFRALHLIDFDLLVRKRNRVPTTAELSDGEVVLVEDCGVQKWACLNCPGGCGEMISLSLNPKRRPGWSLLRDVWSRPSVSPSVHQTNQCGCHFWIKEGRIDWCPGGKPHEPRENVSP